MSYEGFCFLLTWDSNQNLRKEKLDTARNGNTEVTKNSPKRAKIILILLESKMQMQKAFSKLTWGISSLTLV